MAAPTIVGTQVLLGSPADIGGVTPVLAPVPAGTEVGDHLIVILAAFTSVDDGFSFYAEPSTPADWTQLAGSTSVSSLRAGTLSFQIWATAYTEKIDLGFEANYLRRVLPVSITVRDTRSVANWVIGTLCDRSTYGTSTTTVATAITTAHAETLVLGLFGERTTAKETDVTSVAGATKEAFYRDSSSSSIESVLVTREIIASPGSSGDTTVTYPNSQALNGYGIQIAVPPREVAGVPPVAAFSVETHNLTVNVDGSTSSDPDGTIVSYGWTWGDGNTGTGVTASHTYATEGTYTVTLLVTDNDADTDTASSNVQVVEAPPKTLVLESSYGPVAASAVVVGSSGPVVATDVRILPPGYATVAEMLAQDAFYIAHRGGSRDHPEMSLHAYTQSVALGYPAIEISLGRTSDGVWFGLHDQTLDRTSGVTAVTASSLTWSQVQAYNILGSTAVNNTTQPNRPYMRLEELLERYYPSHVIFIDPKYQLSNRTELLDKIDALSGTPQDHIVFKYYGVEGNLEGTSGLAVDAAARGYHRWGYFYEGDNIADYQGRWSILGMEYSPLQAVWDAILAYGKPVVGHICPTQVAVDTALSKGAHGLMVSGAIDVTPAPIVRL